MSDCKCTGCGIEPDDTGVAAWFCEECHVGGRLDAVREARMRRKVTEPTDAVVDVRQVCDNVLSPMIRGLGVAAYNEILDALSAALRAAKEGE